MSSWLEILKVVRWQHLSHLGKTSAGSFCLWLLFSILPLLDGQYGCRAENTTSTLSRDTVWTSFGGPYLIDDDLHIPSGTILTIESGTKILFGAGASLVIEGCMTAIGTLENPILFSSANPNPSPGDWGSLRFDNSDPALSNTENQNRFRGSHLEHCIIEFGGHPDSEISNERPGGAIRCQGSSPRLINLIIRHNRSFRGGGIYCSEFSSPHISGCLFLENEAVESGGGLACFFYSNPVVENNVFQANTAGRHGGAIYCSFSSPQVTDNVIENNVAGSHAGGFFLSNMVTLPSVVVRNNVLLSNQADSGSNGIFVTAGVEAIFRDNCFLSGGDYDVYVEALDKDLDLSKNYFGPLSTSEMELRIFDEFDDPEQYTVIVDPILESPPEHAPNAPQDIISIELYGDDSFSTEWPWPICTDTPIHIEARALDRNPYHEDWIPLHLWSNSSLQGLKVLAWETGSATGIYRFSGFVGASTAMGRYTIGASVGDTLHCRICDPSGFEIHRLVEEPGNYSSDVRAMDNNRSIGE